jgi:hypothetical protein
MNSPEIGKNMSLSITPKSKGKNKMRNDNPGYCGPGGGCIII